MNEERTVGVLGLGSMGMGVALTLVEHQFSVRGFDVRTEAMDVLVEAGGGRGASPREVVEGCGTVIVLVVNAPEDAPTWVLETNAACLESLRSSSGEDLDPAPPMQLLEQQSGDVLLIDRSSSGRRLPAGEGVGLARKIAADVALAIKRYQIVLGFRQCNSGR